MVQSKSKGCGLGCLGYGCLIAVTLFVVVGGGVAYYAVKSVRSAVEMYTVDAPPKIPVPAVDPSVLVAAAGKMTTFTKAVESGAPAVIELSTPEIEGFIQSTPWRERLRVSVDGSQVSWNFSFPLSALGEWPAARVLLGDRLSRAVYGSARTSISFSNGAFVVKFSELVLNGKALEEMAQGHAGDWVSGALNSLGGVDSEPKVRDAFQRIEAFEIQNGVASLRVRGN